ncbi:hypothetical protein RN001_010299 [Aquatica leii]|uniref:Ciliogenesis-associated TTC17-interacting protein N-terminal domain-containing protein n=1 Tax=Aquatica leii TaxID=1421715 RepID=A0AAN7P7Q3_9COLE|nr:hypothetical protein RN001_010299 [Aquatica leii]
MNSEEFPRSITEDILKYLEEQEQLCGEDDTAQDDHGIKHMRTLIEQIIEKITNRAEYIDEYNEKLKAHNQYPLFNLTKIIPNFEIDDHLYEQLTFRETLVISSFESAPNPYVPTIVGGLCLDVQSAKGKNPLVRKQTGLKQSLIELITNLEMNRRNGTKSISQQELDKFIVRIKPQYERSNCKFLVHLSSEFDVEGNQAGSTITAWVDRNLHTLEEKRSEHIICDGVTNEKVLYFGIQPRRYYIKHMSTLEKLLDKKYYSMEKACNLIGEGANFILMRYLAVSRHIGIFELSSMYINGDMCLNVYNCRGLESGIVNDQKLDLCHIHRTIIEECGITHYCKTILTLQGQIIKQEWKDCNHILQVNPLAYVHNEKPTGNEHILLHQIWEKDMQLLSKYLDSKTTYAMDIKSYLADHPELKDMMADYVQKTLFMKPEDVLDFTIKHFNRFCPAEKSHKVNVDEEDVSHIIV